MRVCLYAHDMVRKRIAGAVVVMRYGCGREGEAAKGVHVGANADTVADIALVVVRSVVRHGTSLLMRGA